MENVTEAQLREAATAKILARRDDLLREQIMVRHDQERLAAREREIDRELAECKAAARFFGLVIETPPDEREIADLRRQVVMCRQRAEISDERGMVDESREWRARARAAEARLRNAVATAEHFAKQGVLTIRHEVAAPEQQASPAAVEANTSLTPKSKMPKIKDIALDQLRSAGAAGMKAAPIHQYIETTYSTKLHGKTVGMTLYRLAIEKLVHREGQTWFYGPQAGQAPPASPEDPGAGTPGVAHEAG